MDDKLLNNYILPEHIENSRHREAIENAYAAGALGTVGQADNMSGVSVLGGHDRGMRYFFFHHLVLNPTKSLEAQKPVYDKEECIRFLVSRRNQPTYQIRFLTPDRLAFNDFIKDDKEKYSKPIGGAYLKTYLQWKQGLSSGELSLDRWGELSTSQVLALRDEGIFSLEQFAALPPERVQYFDLELQEAHEKAQEKVASKDVEAKNEALSKQLMELMEENKKMADRLEKLETKTEGKPAEEKLIKRGTLNGKN